MGDYRERKGTLAVGSTVYDVWLARWRTNPYRVLYEEVWPNSSEVYGAGSTSIADPRTRQWWVRYFSGGEGDEVWTYSNKRYHESKGVVPKTYGEGLILGPYILDTLLTGGGAFTDSYAFGIVNGTLWTGANTTLHQWDVTNSHWEVGEDTGVAAGDWICSIADGADGVKAYIGWTDGTNHGIRVLTVGGANAEWYATGTWAWGPLLIDYEGILYGLDGDDLYEVSKALANTRTLVGDVTGRSTSYRTDAGIQGYQRICATDKGLVWYQLTDNGETFIWEYNQALDTLKRIGKLPVAQAYPYSISWANGWYFVGFRYAARNASSGLAYIYYQRGAQRGVAGPVREHSTGPVRIAGLIGDRLMFYAGGAFYGYDLSTGGIIQLGLAKTSSATTPSSAITFGKDIFLANSDAALGCERVDTLQYSDAVIADGWCCTGRSDLGYPGLDKILVDVTVVTNAFANSGTVQLYYSSNGGATFTAATGTFTGDSSTTSYTWTISTTTTTVIGQEFELRVHMASTSRTASPEIRAIFCRVISGEKQQGWILEVDTGTNNDYLSAHLLADLRALCATQNLVAFVNPWDGDEADAPTSYTVRVAEAVLGEAEGDYGPFAQLTVRRVSYV